jgi:uncharacterized membrane protein YcfT
MDNIWIYAGAGFAGFLWGSGTVRGEAVIAFMAGLWMGNSSVVQWAVLALIAGYIIGSLMSKKGQTTK